MLHAGRLPAPGRQFDYGASMVGPAFIRRWWRNGLFQVADRYRELRKETIP